MSELLVVKQPFPQTLRLHIAITTTTIMDQDHPMSVETSVTIKKIGDALASVREWDQFKQQQPLSVKQVDMLAVDMRKLESEVRYPHHSPSLSQRLLGLWGCPKMAKIWAVADYL